MTPMRRIVMVGAAAALLAVGAVGCSDDGEVTAPGPGPAVEEPGEAEEPGASDGGGESEVTDEYGAGEQDEDDLFDDDDDDDDRFEDDDDAEDFGADVFEKASKVLKQVEGKVLGVKVAGHVSESLKTANEHLEADALGSTLADRAHEVLKGLEDKLNEEDQVTSSV